MFLPVPHILCNPTTLNAPQRAKELVTFTSLRMSLKAALDRPTAIGCGLRWRRGAYKPFSGLVTVAIRHQCRSNGDRTLLHLRVVALRAQKWGAA